jgi:hypothetical protein
MTDIQDMTEIEVREGYANGTLTNCDICDAPMHSDGECENCELIEELAGVDHSEDETVGRMNEETFQKLIHTPMSELSPVEYTAAMVEMSTRKAERCGFRYEDVCGDIPQALARWALVLAADEGPTDSISYGREMYLTHAARHMVSHFHMVGA